MPDLENVIKAAEDYEPYARALTNLTVKGDLFLDMLTLLKEQEQKTIPRKLKLKMWSALYDEEDKLEKKFIGTEKHDDWFTVYRPWLQRGFEIAIKVIAEQDGR